jgi:hypothetical protein
VNYDIYKEYIFGKMSMLCKTWRVWKGPYEWIFPVSILWKSFYFSTKSRWNTLASENKRIGNLINSLSTTEPKFAISSWVGANAKKSRRETKTKSRGKITGKRQRHFLKDHKQILLLQLSQSRDKKHRDHK